MKDRIVIFIYSTSKLDETIIKMIDSILDIFFEPTSIIFIILPN